MGDSTLYLTVVFLTSRFRVYWMNLVEVLLERSV